MNTIKRIVTGTATIILSATLPVLAAGTADTNLVSLSDNAEATFDYVKPIAFAIAGALILWAVGKRIFNRLSK